MSLYAGWDPPRPGWTCRECGFNYDATEPASTPEVIRAFGRRYQPPFTRGLPGEDLDALVRVRPSPERWSALEYACHVRDALALYDERIGRVLTEERPELPPMGRDEVVVERAYNSQDPLHVLEGLAAAAEGLAGRLAAVTADGWDRVGVREGEELSVAWMARNSVHEGDHHLLDIGRVLREVRGR